MIIRCLFYGALGALIMILSSGVNAQASANPVEDERLIDVGGFVMNSLLLEPGHKPDLPPIVFIHGASTSLYDPLVAFRSSLEGRARLLFVDRPGHGRSEIGGKRNILPDGQADAIANLMDKRGIKNAIVVGHSYGGAIAAALALRHQERSGDWFSCHPRSTIGRVASPGTMMLRVFPSAVFCSAPLWHHRPVCWPLEVRQSQCFPLIRCHRIIYV